MSLTSLTMTNSLRLLGAMTVGVCARTYSNRIHILPYPIVSHDLSVSVDSHPFVVTVTDPFRLVIPPVRQSVPYPPFHGKGEVEPICPITDLPLDCKGAESSVREFP